MQWYAHGLKDHGLGRKEKAGIEEKQKYSLDDVPTLWKGHNPLAL